MSELELSTVLISIVVAIAITEILTAWSRMIRLRRCVKPYRVQMGWSALVVLLCPDLATADHETAEECFYGEFARTVGLGTAAGGDARGVARKGRVPVTVTADWR
ncbi:MAG: hypothetical protein ACLFWG_01035, partial [Longimicrobiales bacterium]